MGHISRRNRTGRRLRRLATGGCLSALVVLSALVLPSASEATSHDAKETNAHEFTGKSLVPEPMTSSAAPEWTALSVLTGHGSSVGIPVPPGWTSSVQQIKSGSLLRDYVLVRPSGSGTGPLPVLVVLHGHNMTPAGIAKVTDFLAVIGRAVVVYPAGFGRSWNAGGCCGLAHTDGIDDVSFLTTVVHDVLATVPGTSDKAVFLAGFSNGGRMAFHIACTDPKLFTGVAAVEAVPVVACEKPHPISLAIVAYQDDPLLSISKLQPIKDVNGMAEPRIDNVVAQWRHIDGCKGNPFIDHEGTATINIWTACQDHTRVEYDLYAAGSHHWPQGDPNTPSASQLIWKFLHSADQTSQK